MTTRHDYRVQGWGHAFAGFRRTGDVLSDGAPIFKGCVFGRSIHEGDDMVLNQTSGRAAVYRVLTVRRPLDPGDQYFITAYPHHYLDEEPTVDPR